MAPLFVTLSIFIKGLPVVYPGRGLIAGRRGERGPCCHFHCAKEGLLLAAPKGPGFKGSGELFRPGCALQIRGAVKCWQVASISTYMWWRTWSGFGWSSFNRWRPFLRPPPSIFCLKVCYPHSLPLPNQLRCPIFPNLAKPRLVNMKQSRLCPFAVLRDWCPPLTNTVTTVTGSLWHTPETSTTSASVGKSA